MKIRNLKVEKYKSIDSIYMDFTYPYGHEKEGFAFDKICFIGQSGTGKTQLLYLIMQLSVMAPKISSMPEGFPIESSIEAEFETEIDGQPFFIKKQVKKGKVTYKGLHFMEVRGGLRGGLDKKRNASTIIEEDFNQIHTYFFPAQVDYLPARQYYQKILGSNADKSISNSGDFFDYHFNQCLFCYQDTLNVTFSAYVDKINSYNLMERDMRVDASYYGENGGDIISFIKNWKSQNENPSELFLSESLNDILDEIDLSVEFDSSEDEGVIAFKRKNGGSFIPLDELSSGARQLVSMALPLLVHKPEKSLILIDEADSSLYPSMQLRVVPFFTSVGQDNQVFLATHSPIIASYFEPWEIMELKFNEDKSVYVESNLIDKSKRAVENYSIDARYLTWTSILTRLFEIGQNSNEEVRLPALMEMSSVKNEIAKIKKGDSNKIDTERLRILTDRYVYLANLLDWKE